MKNLIYRAKRILKKLSTSLKEVDIEIVFPNEKSRIISEEEEVYENILCKIKSFFKKLLCCLKGESSVEIVFPKDQNFNPLEKADK